MSSMLFESCQGLSAVLCMATMMHMACNLDGRLASSSWPDSPAMHELVLAVISCRHGPAKALQAPGLHAFSVEKQSQQAP